MNKNELSFDIPLSRIDKIKCLQLPKKLTDDLAYLCGVFAGDGNIEITNKQKYALTCLCNAFDEREFYFKVVFPKFKESFGFLPSPKHYSRDNTFGFKVASKSIILFLTKIIGLPSGKKYDYLKIPELFLHDSKLIINFIRGLFDTDGCITFKKRYRDYPYYPVIIFSSKSKRLTKEIAVILKYIGFNIIEIYAYKVIDIRFKAGFNFINRIEMNGKNNLDRWIDLIGFYNPKHLEKINRFYKK